MIRLDLLTPLDGLQADAPPTRRPDSDTAYRRDFAKKASDPYLPSLIYIANGFFMIRLDLLTPLDFRPMPPNATPRL